VGVHLGQVRRIDPDRPHVRDRAAGIAPLKRGPDVVNGIVQPTTRLKFGREPPAFRPGDGPHTGPPLELRDDQCVPMFVGYDTGSDESERRVSAALDTAAVLGIRWGDDMAVETR
jgi:hypothetical protein